MEHDPSFHSETALASAFTREEVRLLQACVGFHARSQTDPGIRERLYDLWCKLDRVRSISGPADSAPVAAAPDRWVTITAADESDPSILHS